MSVGFLVATGDDGGSRQNRFKEGLGEVGAAMMAALGNVAAEYLAPSSQKGSFTRRTACVMLEQKHPRRLKSI